MGEDQPGTKRLAETTNINGAKKTEAALLETYVGFTCVSSTKNVCHYAYGRGLLRR